MVTDQEDWSVYLAQWLRGLVGKAIPVLGICYGHHRAYIQEQRAGLLEEGYVIEEMDKSVRQHSYGKTLLKRFGELIL